MDKSLTNRQIAVILYSIIIGYDVVNIPKEIAEAAGTGSWFPLIIATIIFVLITYMITYLQYVFEGKTLYEYSTMLVGRFLTSLFMFICMIYFFMFLTMLVRLYGETIKLIILNKTPVMLICMVTFIVIGYAVIKGINVIARLCEIYVPINILGTIIITSLLATKGRYVNLRPLFSTEEIRSYIMALKTIVLPFLGMEILLFIPINQKENKHVFKYTMLMVVFIGALFIFLVESVISVVGVESVIYLKATVLSVLKGIDLYNIDIIRRLDGLYIIIWTMNIVCAMSLWAYGVTVIIRRKLKNINNNLLVIIVMCISFIVSQTPKTMEQVQRIIKYNTYLGLIVALVIPAILFTVMKVKKYDKQI